MKILRSNRGIVIVYTTLFLLVLGLLFIALGVDIGWMAYVRTQGQASVDAASLRGAAGLDNYNNNFGSTIVVNSMATGVDANNTVMNQNSGSAASSTAIEVCTGNPGSPQCPVTLPPPAQWGDGVRVTRSFPTPLYFTRFINGATSSNITVSSTAWLGAPGGLRPELPITLCRAAIYPPPTNTCVPGYSVNLNPNNQDNGAYWNFDPNAAPANQPTATGSQCPNWVHNPSNIPYISQSNTIGLNNGAITSCMQAIQNDYGSCTPASCLPTAPQAVRDFCTVILPVIDCPGSIVQQQPVKEFAALCITGVQATPASSAYITGLLQCNVQAPGARGGGFGGGSVRATIPVLVQ